MKVKTLIHYNIIVTIYHNSCKEHLFVKDFPMKYILDLNYTVDNITNYGKYNSYATRQEFEPFFNIKDRLENL